MKIVGMILFLGIIFTNVALFCNGEFIEMKVVEEPSSLGFQQSFGNFFNQQEEKLKLRVQPANFSGPAHFKRLVGRCFHNIINDYKYSFCPYANITQEEQNAHWNPYKGVLGVWQEWEIKNNTFTAMMMREGDTCGDMFRSVKVMLMCGKKSEIVNATEPQRCSYELLFKTPLVCAEDSTLVYPTLSPTLRNEWDLLEGEMAAGYLTQKGYNRRLASIFEKAGYYLTHEKKKTLVKKEEEKAKTQEQEFSDLLTCNSAYALLKHQNEALSHQIALINQSGPP